VLLDGRVDSSGDRYSAEAIGRAPRELLSRDFDLYGSTDLNAAVAAAAATAATTATAAAAAAAAAAARDFQRDSYKQEDTTNSKQIVSRGDSIPPRGRGKPPSIGDRLE